VETETELKRKRNEMKQNRVTRNENRYNKLCLSAVRSYLVLGPVRLHSEEEDTRQE
jgi:hypothetical protein